MKVLLANSPFGGGGITTYCRELVACLSKDVELTVVLTDDSKRPIKNPDVKVLYHNTTSLTFENAKFFINLINNDIKPDVIIISAATIVSVIVPYLNDNIKIISVSHSGKYFYSDYCAVNHKYIDRIIAASSNYNKNYLERKFHISDKKKIKVIYNFVANDPELESLYAKKKEQQTISIIFVGGSSIGKSPELVAKIVSALLTTDLNFMFYWFGSPTVPLTTNIFKHSKLKNAKQLFPGDKRLCFPGRIPSKKDFDLLIGGANIMLAPSKNEGCSMALLEGHRSGTIMLVADYENSNREIVQAGNSGFVIDHNDVGAFVHRISDIINNPASYSNYYENSHDTFESMLSYPVWRQSIIEVLNSPINHNNRRKKVSRLGITKGIFIIKWLQISSLINRFFQLSLPSYCSFRRQYAIFNNQVKNKKN